MVTDSCSGMPPDLAAASGVTVVPLTVCFGEEAFRDGVDISAAEFYRRLASAPELPSTSQPPVAEFLKVFARLVDEGDCAGILVVTLSHKVSGTYQSALQAAREFTRVPVEVMDSLTASVPQMFCALAAARAAAGGASLAEVAGVAREVAGRARLYAMLDTLEYLRRGGRIGRAAAWAGAILQIKPVLTLERGEVVPVVRLRTRRKALEYIVNRLREEVVLGKPLHAGILHADSPREAAALAEQVEREFRPVELIVSEFTPVMGAHTGPGVLGVGYYHD